MRKATVNVATLLRENSAIGDRRKTYLRVSAEAVDEAVHKIGEIMIPEIARIAAENANARKSKTVQLVDLLDAWSYWRRL